MDFAWSVAHPFVLDPGAPTGFADNTYLKTWRYYGGYIPTIWERSAICVLLNATGGQITVKSFLGLFTCNFQSQENVTISGKPDTDSLMCTT